MLTLLFRLAEWHALAKLRMHTESTLTHMEQVTKTLGYELRQFSSVTCAAFKTKETPKEADARNRRRNQKRATEDAARSKPPDETNSQRRSNESKPKTLNLFVYKIHALGDYPSTIRLFGTTDSFSTQIVSPFL